MSAPKVNVVVGPSDLVVEISGVPHLILRRADVSGVESWAKTIGARETYYCIEFTTKHGVITCDYTRRDLWEAILIKLAQAKPFDEMQGEAQR